MKTRTWLALAAAATVVVGVSAFALNASAFGPGAGWTCQGPAMGQGTGMFGPGMRHGGRGMTMRGGPGVMMMQTLDTDGDGTLTVEEGQAALDGLLQTHDADGDGTLSLAEFETLHAQVTRPRTVDRFQFLDEDGDGRVTAEEMQAPFARMARWMDVDGDGTFAPGDRRGMMGGRGMGQGPGTMQRP